MRLTVVGYAGKAPNSRMSRWHCECSCGNKSIVFGASLTSKTTLSCGCLNREIAKETASKNFRKHGLTGMPEHNAWMSMLSRVSNTNASVAKHYLDKGIVVCTGLRDFDIFWKILGEKPSAKHSIDRINSELSYTCGICEQCKWQGWKLNVRWADKKMQARNRSFARLLEHDGQTKCLSEWAECLGLPASALYLRIYRRKWTIERALTTPLMKRSKNGRD